MNDSKSHNEVDVTKSAYVRSRKLKKPGTLFQRLRKRIHQHEVVAAMASILGIAGSITAPYIWYLQDQIRTEHQNAETQNALFKDERLAFEKRILEMGKTHHHISVVSPKDEDGLAGEYVTLQWLDSDQASNYYVEVQPPGSATPFKFLATRPDSHRTRYPAYATENPLPPGWYSWRVAPAVLTGIDITPKIDQWTGYYRFRLYDKVISRIKETGLLRVGVTYNQHSIFMKRGEVPGSADGFDGQIINAVSKILGEDKEITRPLKVKYIEFPSNELLLQDGLRTKLVDLAVGALTNTRARQQQGILFSRGYLNSHMVLLSSPHGSCKPMKGSIDEMSIGVVDKTTNFEAARLLHKKYRFLLVPKGNFDDLLDDLLHHKLDCIINDEPLVKALIDHKILRVVERLDSELQRAGYYKDIVGSDIEHFAIGVSDEELRDKLDKIMSHPSFLKDFRDICSNTDFHLEEYCPLEKKSSNKT